MNTEHLKWNLIPALVACAILQAYADPNVIQEHYRWRYDDGGETTPPPPAGATWKQNLDVPHTGQAQNQPIRLRFSLSNTGEGDSDAFAAVLQYSDNKFSDYQAVPASLAAVPGAPFVMANSVYYSDDDPASTELLPGSQVAYQPGKCVEAPANGSTPVNLLQSRHINFEYCFMATTNSVGGQTYYFRIANDGSDLNEYKPESYAQLTVIAAPVVGNAAGASALSSSSATLNGLIESTGGDSPIATIYWGPTDGTTNKPGSGPDAWSNEISLAAQSGVFAASISGLTANQSYFYRCYATNLAGGAWAPTTTTFTTTAPDLRFTNAPYVVQENSGTATLTLSIENKSATTVTVGYATADGTALAGLDYGITSGIVTWNPGDSTTKTLTVPLVDDGVGEPTEAFQLILSNPTNGSVNEASQATVTILDDDGVPSLQYEIATAGGDESLGTTNITITLSHASAANVTVDYYVAGGTATPTTDYSIPAGTATIVSNTLSTTIPLQIVDDTLYETPETVILGLSNAVNALIGVTSNHTFTVTDADPRAAAVDNGAGAANIQAVSATLRGQVTDTGRDNPQVYVYWGVSDGMTNKTGGGPGSWDQAVDAGVHGVETFSANISGLSSGTVYYYRCYVTNAGGEAWAVASETFTANDPPTFQLLANVSIEDAGTPDSDAAHWLRSSLTSIARTNAFARTQSYAFKFTQSANRYVSGTGENKFRCTWNGQYSAGGVHPKGGVRPGFIASGTASTRAQVGGGNPAAFEYALYMVNAASSWASGSLTHSNIVYQTISFNNATPLTTNTVSDDFRPVLRRNSAVAGEGLYYADDLTMTMSLPRLVLQRDPSNIVSVADTPVGLWRELDFGARSQGGATNSVLYGAYITNAADNISASWSNKAWQVAYDPGNAFSIVAGATLVSTNDGPWCQATLRFAPPAPGAYTATVQIATTDPNNYYDGGGTLQGSIIYERYIVTGGGIAPPTVSINDTSLPEGNAGSSLATFTLNLSKATIGDVTVACTTSNGTATAGSDYTGFSQQVVTIPAGQTIANVTVTIRGDTDMEGDEVFYVWLTDPTNASPGTVQGTCTIRSDDVRFRGNCFSWR